MLDKHRATETDSDTDTDTAISLRPDDLDDLLTRAAERGAERCLAHLGLENGHDRQRHPRTARSIGSLARLPGVPPWRTLIRTVTTGILSLLLIGAAIKLKLMGGPQ